MQYTLGLGLAILLALANTACTRPTEDPAPVFQEVGMDPGAALLSVAGTSEEVWVVGARPSPTAGPLLLRHTADGWESLDSGQQHDLWWVHAFEGGPTFVAGAGATVLRIENGVIERTPTPVFFANTVYGVWGASPDDVWAVGGRAGRDGFAWRYDGETWTEVALVEDLPRNARGEIPGLFKVWGRAHDDVWMVGGLGTVLHWDGTSMTRIPVDTSAPLFTVTGDADEVVIVGGSDTGVLLRGGVDGFVDDTPPDAPLLQAVTIDRQGRVLAAGGQGFAVREQQGAWQRLDLGFSSLPQSVHALWAGDDQIWGVGGNVLSPALDEGVICSTRDLEAYTAPEPEPPDTQCPADQIDLDPEGSIARRWNEQLLNSIRRDIPHPPKHARNLFHVSVAMWDAWATWQDLADGYVYTERHTAADIDEARRVAISYAAHRVLSHRYAGAIGGETSLDCYDGFMGVLGLDPEDRHTDGDDPIAVGNRIGEMVIAHFADDGANEANNYADTTGWSPANPVMVVDVAGTNVDDPNIWQQLNLGTAETQNGIVLEDSVQPYIAPHWRHVEPFALVLDPVTGLYSDPVNGYPTIDDPEMVDWVVEVIRKTAELDIDDGVMIDIGPGGLGNNPLGSNDGEGYDVNPVTGEPYPENLVPRGDFTRVVAEIWADGPKSETPPGHWTKLGNDVSDRLADAELVPFGQGGPVDRLQWDVGLYFTVTAAVHDAAISAWELKRDSLGPRPITLIRWMAQNGQRSDASLPNYHEQGLPLIPDLIEVITPESSAPGQRHHHLRYYVGELAIRSWPGEPGDRASDYTPLTWIRALDWIPYQRRTFVTPAFPGFTSGHSTFSRAAAEALTAYTGSPYFPGGLHEFVANANEYLIFEDGPSVEVRLQWASYYDAADQAGQSRLWGGIHIAPDDFIGRINGSAAGQAVAVKALTYIDGSAQD